MESGDATNEEFFTHCRICFQLFDIEQSKPLLLKCTHTFCFKCLKELYKDNSLQCPFCRTSTIVDDLASLPRNMYVEHIVYMHHHREIEKDLGLLQWCFNCKKAGSPLCLKDDHVVYSMSTYAEKLNSEIALCSFGEAIENWKTINEDLKKLFRTKPSYSEEVFELMDNVDQKIEILSTQLKTFKLDHKKEENNKMQIKRHYERKDDFLVESTKRLNEIKKRLQEIRQEPTGSQNLKCQDSPDNVNVKIPQANGQVNAGVKSSPVSSVKITSKTISKTSNTKKI